MHAILCVILYLIIINSYCKFALITFEHDTDIVELLRDVINNFKFKTCSIFCLFEWINYLKLS